MTKRELIILDLIFERALFNLAFLKYPTREEVRAALKSIWDTMSKEAQDQSFDFLTFADSFPAIELPNGTEHYSLSGCVRIRRVKVWDNSKPSDGACGAGQPGTCSSN